MTIADVVKRAGIEVAKIAAADAAAYIVAHKDALLKAAATDELDVEKELVGSIVANLPTGGAWGLGLRASVAKTIAGAGAQIVADLGGRNAAVLVAVQAHLEAFATSQ